MKKLFVLMLATMSLVACTSKSGQKHKEDNGTIFRKAYHTEVFTKYQILKSNAEPLTGIKPARSEAVFNYDRHGGLKIKHPDADRNFYLANADLPVQYDEQLAYKIYYDEGGDKVFVYYDGRKLTVGNQYGYVALIK